MNFSALLRLTEQPVCTAWINGEINEGSLEKLPPFRGSLVVLLPTTEILLSSVKLPIKQTQRIRQAVPYALEENLADDVENLHFALGQRDKAGNQAVAVISHHFMQSILQRLKNASLQVHSLLPDVLAVPYPSNGWGILYLGGLALVRTGAHSGFAIEQAQLPEWCQLALNDKSLTKPETIDLYSHDSGTELLQGLATQGIEIHLQQQEQGAIALLAETLKKPPKAASLPLNLIQTPYQQRDLLQALWKPWRLTAGLLVLWLALWLGLAWQENQQLQQQKISLKQQINALYRETFPKARKIVNPKVQMERALNQLKQQNRKGKQDEGLLQLLLSSHIALLQTPKFYLKKLDYQKNTLHLDFELASLQDLESLKQKLKNAGLQVSTQSASSQDHKAKVRLKIQKK
ncbi:type II secretion system protein GspL [Candidatus Venteria ishoeyi]|uniref:type II secretion system protein GspL n=1 Tax=Candidatus Venteria ishoeyi TaxID=1899563 RepID=UPI0025A54790|nr:type II secretion system protein GspL [Candidatus Venteria ishoeyi]MDM8547590.1 type II secretion system protein GspL [Candidatus Venteria ishoeyi]